MSDTTATTKRVRKPKAVTETTPASKPNDDQTNPNKPEGKGVHVQRVGDLTFGILRN